MTSQPLNIALPISSFLPNLGGMEVGLHNIARGLVERGLRPVVMAPFPHVAQLRRNGWALPYEVRAFPPKIWSILYRAPALGFFILDLYFARMQQRYRFDCWHCTMGYPTGVALIHFARRRPGLAYLIRCAGDDIQRLPQIGYGARLDPSIDRMVRRLLPESRMLIAISDTVAQEYSKIGVPDDRIRHIPNGVDLTRFNGAVERSDVRAAHGLDPDAFLFLSIGRNHPKKNYPVLIEAGAALSRLTDRRFQIAIVGRDASKLRPLVEEQGPASPIRLIEEIGGGAEGSEALALPPARLIELYKAADTFVFPSMLETFGIAIIEAMAAGLPVIVGDSPGCRDLVRGGRDGVLVPPADSRALAEAMLAMMDDAARCADYGARSLARAQDFAWDGVVDRYCRLYEELRAA